MDDLLDLPVVGDVRGMVYFYAIELVKDRETRRGTAPTRRHNSSRASSGTDCSNSAGSVGPTR
jgi:4-aminobutyrate aminotransferase-like enzyme